jgi:hypothetical protein
MARSLLSLNGPGGTVRSTDSCGRYCVTLEEFQAVGWNDDTRRYCRFTGIIHTVTIVPETVVWEDAPEADPFEINEY